METSTQTTSWLRRGLVDPSSRTPPEGQALRGLVVQWLALDLDVSHCIPAVVTAQELKEADAKRI
jgi:hypothetical protein